MTINSIITEITEFPLDISNPNPNLLFDSGDTIYKNNVFHMIVNFSDKITIKSFTIDFYHRRQKFGKHIYNAFESEFKSLGYKEIQLHLVSHNAKDFWAKMGFSEINHIWTKKIAL
jgi:ribosomal protein S18 acetylase RimI-like enzyme